MLYHRTGSGPRISQTNHPLWEAPVEVRLFFDIANIIIRAILQRNPTSRYALGGLPVCQNRSGFDLQNLLVDFNVPIFKSGIKRMVNRFWSQRLR